jgi:hypothetical protein
MEKKKEKGDRLCFGVSLYLEVRILDGFQSSRLQYWQSLLPIYQGLSPFSSIHKNGDMRR